jgi:hypothetical protein
MTYGQKSHKGRYVPKHPEKYVGDISSIWYRSGLERTFMVWCDSNTNVVSWNSEEVVVPYFSPMDNRSHRYFVDFIIQIKNTKGELRVYLVEIKPFQFTKEPVRGKKKTATFLAEAAQWGVNQAKWGAAKQFCKSKNWEFIILTERDLVK